MFIIIRGKSHIKWIHLTGWLVAVPSSHLKTKNWKVEMQDNRKTKRKYLPLEA